jgi:hypothetical protein
LRAEVETAQLAVKQAERTVGERRAEDLDITSATEELRQVGDRLRALEAALCFAIQKDEAAQADLKQAEQQAQRELLREKLTKQLAAGKKIDKRLDGLMLDVNEFNDCRKEVLELGYPDINMQENVADLSFKTYLFRACPTLAGCTTGYAVFQMDARWSAPWSASLPQPDQADHVRFTLPAAKPIPGRKIED